jgi:hypothetical protein
LKDIIVYNDIHLKGPHPVKVNWEYGPHCYYLGDNVDLSHCRKEDVLNALITLTFMSNLFQDRFVRGNHELNAIDKPDKLVVGKTLLTHGDYIFWPKKYADRYRQKPQGANWLKRWFSFSGIDPIRFLLPEARLHRRSLRKMAFLAKKNKCTMIVVGHRHPKRTIRYEYRGIKIIVLPPGKNYIRIDE